MLDPTRTNDRDLDRLELDEIRRFLGRSWKLIAGMVFASALIASAICLLMTPIYTATSQILLDPRKPHVFGGDTPTPDMTLDSSVVDSQIPIILSNRLLAKVITKENLAEDPEFAAPARAGLMERLLSLFHSRPEPQDAGSFDGIDPRLAPVITHLFNRVDVTRVAKSFVLSVSVSSRDPDKATRLANTIAETYVEDRIEVYQKTVQQTASFFEQRLAKLRDQVRASESAVAEYRKAHDLTTTSMDGKITVGEQQLQSLNEELAKISADTAEKHARYQQAIAFAASGAKLDTLPEIIRSPVITQLRTQQADLTRREADLAAMYGPAYPAITQIRAQRQGLDRAVALEMKRLTATLKNEYEVARAREDSLRKTIAGLSDSSGGDNEIGVKLRELERANLANKALFENFLNRAKLTQEQSTFEEPDARLISPALVPAAPSSPKIKLVVPMAAALGLILGLGLAAFVDGRVRPQKSDVPLRGDALILGTVPYMRRLGHGSEPLGFLARHPDSHFTRNLKSLAAKLAGPAGPASHLIAFVPLGPGEGASTLALCLADLVGREGRRVLLIDMGGGAAPLASLSSKPQSGLTDVLAHHVSANKALHKLPHFALLPRGESPLDAMAARKALQTFLNEAKSRYNLIILDTPSYAAGAHSISLAGLAEAFVLVASWDHMMRDTFVSAIDQLADQRGFAGVILNRTAGAEEQVYAKAS